MRNDRKLLLLTVAAVLACGILGNPARAQDLAAGAQARVISIGHVTDVIPDATSPGFFQGITAMGPLPPTSGDWPCFGGGADCSGVASGGLVVGTPEQVWSKSCSGCGQIYWTLQTTTATGAATVTVTVTQGTTPTEIFSFTGSVGTIAAGVIDVIELGPISFTGGVAGAATINVATTIGSTTVKGGAKIVLH